MKKYLILILLTALIFGCRQAEIKFITPVDFSDVTINDSFWAPRLEKHKNVTLEVCIDQIENQTGRIRNFENAASGQGEHLGIFFDDSDVYKALEGMAYSLQNNPDPELEKKCDEWISKFAAAQQDDGYINTFYTLTGLDKRWTDMDKHEMYCAGHMTEAAIAYYKVTGKRELLDVSIRMADHMMTVFGPGKRHWVPGHEEIELALVKLFEVTGQKKYLEFAQWLIDERGHGHGSYGNPDRRWPVEYYQDETPVRQMTDISGHAVRCMYLYCGMSDVAAYTGDKGYIEALDRLWEDVALRNMYITGGIGSSRHNEGFTTDYDLPNLDAYCETCASVGMVLWNWRMNQFTGESKYIDTMERSLYNGALAGISLSGDRFFYVNPLESHGNHHRQEWYGCACCPSQICRFLPSIGNYIYGISDDALWVNLYIGNTSEFKAYGKTIKLSQTTNYPWEGSVDVIYSGPSINKQIKLRVPGWCKKYEIYLNDEKLDASISNGYASIANKWKDGDRITLVMDMPVEVIEDDARVKENTGKRAIQRGPLVYCIEQIDNPEFENIALSSETVFSTEFNNDLLEGVQTISASEGNDRILYIPYYAWDNREAGAMKVWVDYK